MKLIISATDTVMRAWLLGTGTRTECEHDFLGKSLSPRRGLTEAPAVAMMQSESASAKLGHILFKSSQA